MALVLLKRFADEFLAFFPECLSVGGIQRVCADAFTNSINGGIVLHQMSDVAVLAVLAADLVSGCNHSCPDGSCGSLGNGLPLERPLAFRCLLLINPVDELLHLA